MCFIATVLKAGSKSTLNAPSAEESLSNNLLKNNSHIRGVGSCRQCRSRRKRMSRRERMIRMSRVYDEELMIRKCRMYDEDV